MDIITAMQIIEQYPPVASMWAVKNSDYDLPEAILTLKADCEENLELHDEFDDLQKNNEKLAGDVEKIKDDYKETFKTMLKGVTSLLDDDNTEVYDDISDFLNDFKNITSDLEDELYKII